MIPTLKRRKGALLYLFTSCSLLVVFFFTSYTSRSGGRLQYTSKFEYPWQMVDYDEDQCGCPRSGPPIMSGSRRSLCSDWSTSRGLHQNVVSYSLYGDPSHENTRESYFDAVENRLQDIEHYYTGFVMRLYHNLSTTEPKMKNFICRLYCKYPHFDPCQIKHIYPETDEGMYEYPAGVPISKGHASGHEIMEDIRAVSEGGGKRIQRDIKRFYKKSHPLKAWGPSRSSVDTSAVLTERKSYDTLLIGKMWRFLVMTDPLVAEFLVRDLDSAILDREVSAVEQWRRNSTALLHAMRDHPSHNGLILAGLWGGSRTRDGEKLSCLLNQMLRWPPRNIWDYDQMMLKRVVWPEITGDLLVHDSYFCASSRFQSKHRSQPFPTQRKERYFVGWGPMRDAELQGIVPCPRQCRPADHQNWVLC